jgi:hypothetical protein
MSEHALRDFLEKVSFFWPSHMPRLTATLHLIGNFERHLWWIPIYNTFTENWMTFVDGDFERNVNIYNFCN